MIDTQISHLVRPGANLSREVGFSAKEAKRLQSATQKQINGTRLLKAHLMSELTELIERHHLEQAEAAEITTMSRPRVFDLASEKAANFRGLAEMDSVLAEFRVTRQPSPDANETPAKRPSNYSRKARTRKPFHA